MFHAHWAKDDGHRKESDLSSAAENQNTRFQKRGDIRSYTAVNVSRSQHKKKEDGFFLGLFVVFFLDFFFYTSLTGSSDVLVVILCFISTCVSFGGESNPAPRPPYHHAHDLQLLQHKVHLLLGGERRQDGVVAPAGQLGVVVRVLGRDELQTRVADQMPAFTAHVFWTEGRVGSINLNIIPQF